MEIEITKMSPKGQVVIPSYIRKELNIQPADRFLVFGRGDTVLFKKIEKTVLEQSFDEIATPIRKEIMKSGFTEKDLGRIIKEVRSRK